MYSQTPETRYLGVLFVQFADQDTNVSARGGCGWIDTTDPPDQIPDTLVNDKYRYKDLWNLFFQENGAVKHPDSASHSGWIDSNKSMLANNMDLYIHGSFRRYWREVSYGLLEILPGETRANESGIINYVQYQGNDPSEGKIEWITLGRTRREYDSLYHSQAALEIRKDALETLRVNPPSGYDSSHFTDRFIVYAGPGFGTSYPGVTNLMSDDLTYARAQFGGMLELVHEFGHQAVFGNQDLHGAERTPSVSWVGLLSLMGDARPMCRLTPPHPDPWNKLRRGWLRYRIVNGSLFNQELPIIEEKYDEERPFVYILPVRGSFSDSMSSGDWDAPGQQYYIIENRRATGFDRYINRFTEHSSGGQYGEELGEGGFVVWDFVGDYHTNSSRIPRVVEADNGYDLSTLPWSYKHKGEPTDFFSDRTFAPWTFPSSLTTVMDNGFPMTEYRMKPSQSGRAVIARFPAYTTTSNVNTIDLLASLDQFSGTDSATMGNNQRKLAVNGQSVLMAHESNGLVFASKSTNAGASWQFCELNTAIEYVNDSTSRPIVGTIPYSESAPSVCWIGNAAWMTWQRKDSSGRWSVLQRCVYQSTSTPTYASSIADSVVATETERTPTPVIGYGYRKMINGQLIPIARIVFSTDSGLYQSVSTDMGTTWEKPAVKIPGTTNRSVHPSLAMNDRHSALVYEEQNSQPEGGADLFISVDDSAVTNLTSAFTSNGLSNHRFPSVSLKNDIVHIVWVADYYETVDSTTQRAAHMQWNATAMPSSVPRTFFDRKYNERPEYSEVPVVATHPSGTQDKGATVFWSVNDILPGARLRFNRYVQNSRTGLYEWQYDVDERNGESGLSELTTRHPAITENTNGTLFVVTRGNSAPYQIASSFTPIDGATTGSRTIDIATFTSSSTHTLMRVLAEQPKLTDGTQLRSLLSNAGVPDSGFDGTSQGPGIRELLRSESVLMDMSDGIGWDVRIVFDSTLSPSDTVFVVGRLLDAATGNVIASSNTVARRIAKRDSSFTLGFELPPSHYPQADVAVTLELSNGPDAAPDRFLGVLHHIYSEDVVPKRQAERVTGSMPSNARLHIYPNPVVDDRIQISFLQITESAVSAEVFDVLGRSVKSQENGVLPAGYRSLPIDVSRLRPGQYFLRIHAGDATLVQRFSVVR